MLTPQAFRTMVGIPIPYHGRAAVLADEVFFVTAKHGAQYTVRWLYF